MTSALSLSWSTVVTYISCPIYVCYQDTRAWKMVHSSQLRIGVLTTFVYIPLTKCRHTICTKVILTGREENEKFKYKVILYKLNNWTTLNKGYQSCRVYNNRKSRFVSFDEKAQDGWYKLLLLQPWNKPIFTNLYQVKVYRRIFILFLITGMLPSAGLKLTSFQC